MYVLRESLIQAFQQLVANKLRSFLSLLGIMIGIFCIIAVKSAMNSLEDNVRKSFDKLGNDVLYINKMPWNEDPNENYWKYVRRPNPGYKDYKVLASNLQTAKAVTYSFFIGAKTVKYQRNSVERAIAVAVTEEYDRFHNLEYEAGRFFSPNEYNMGMNRVLIGAKVADQLFGEEDPIGREIQVMGRKMQVIGVLKRAGRDLLQVYNYDNAVLFSFEFARSVVNVRPNSPWSGNVVVKAADGISVQQLTDDVTQTLRKARYLKPAEKDNFSINSMSMFADDLNEFFGVLNKVGYFIGGFALLVGMFSVANIMFVSVKERTNIIGIKKALGAKQWVILLEFLIESVILCIIGGIFGLIMAWSILKVVSTISLFDMYVSLNNAIVTFVLSIVVGVIAGIIPALQGSRMNPVEAIRS